MEIRELTKVHNLIKLFVELCEIPSPSLKEENLSKRILEIFQSNAINAEYDNFKNIIAKMPASQGYEKTPSLLLSAHMDVVGGSEEVKIKLSETQLKRMNIRYIIMIVHIAHIGNIVV